MGQAKVCRRRSASTGLGSEQRESILSDVATQPREFATVEEYLRQEETALERHEYLAGQIFAMSGGTPTHALIASRIIIEIGVQLRGTGCRIRGADMRIRTAPSGLYTYPDAVISCQPEQVESNALVNPVAIVEVLSGSTRDYDRGAKFERYREIPSFVEYLIIGQDRVYVEHHVREGQHSDAVWTMREYTSLSDLVSLSSVPARLSLSAVYEELEFPA